MVGLVTGGVLNMALDPLFIFGFNMGTGGAGLATALSQAVSFCILLSMYLRGKTVSRFSIRHVTRDIREFGTILAVGLPSFGRQGLASIASMLLNVAASAYGDAAVAGMSIVSRIFMFILSVSLGVGQGFQPVAAFNFGARKYRRVRSACLFTIAAGFVCMAVFVGLCWANGETLVRLFRDDPDVMAVALPALRWQCAAMLLQPVMVSTNMLFQSIGKAGRATLLACCRQGICFIPLILTLPKLWGVTGVQVCQPIADVLTFCISLPILLQYLHELNGMEEAEPKGA
jgi:Na+-driven multidrug efflux pump